MQKAEAERVAAEAERMAAAQKAEVERATAEVERVAAEAERLASEAERMQERMAAQKAEGEHTSWRPSTLRASQTCGYEHVFFVQQNVKHNLINCKIHYE